MSHEQQVSNEPKAGTPPPAGSGARSEGLLPAAGPDDKREVAEEVSLDQQSDSARRVGAMPPGTPGAAVAQALEPDEGAATEQLRQAINRAVPPSA